MTLINRSTTIAAALVAASGTAMAQPDPADALFTFAFSDLNLDYDFNEEDGETGTLVASAQPESAGDVTDVPASTTAMFEDGFVDLAGDSDVTFTFDVFDIEENSADASGEFSITDVDGDVLSAQLEGEWVFDDDGDILTFNGDILDASIDADGNGFFEGTNGSAFAIDEGVFDFFDDTVDGAVVSVSFAGDEFFTEDFDGFNAEFSGVVLPTPAAASLFGLGGLAMTRRRRG